MRATAAAGRDGEGACGPPTQVEVALLLRVLKSAATNNAETVEAKLTNKRVAAQAGDVNAQTKPFLSFTATVSVGSGSPGARGACLAWSRL